MLISYIQLQKKKTIASGHQNEIKENNHQGCSGFLVAQLDEERRWEDRSVQLPQAYLDLAGG